MHRCRIKIFAREHEAVFGVCALHRAQTHMVVLQVGTRVALEREHAVPVKVVIVDALARHVLDLDRGHTDNVGGALGVLELCVFLLVLAHDFVHVLFCLVEDAVEEHCGALARRHALDHTKIDMQEAVGFLLRPREAHKLKHFEELRQVQVLLRGDDVDHLVKAIVAVPALLRLDNVAGDVQRRAVAALNDRLLKLVRREVDQQCTVLLARHKVGVAQLFERALKVCLLYLRLTRILVKANVEALVRLLVLFDRQVAEHFPLSQVLGHTIFHAFEKATRLFVNRLARARLLRKSVDLHVHVKEVLHGVFLQLFFVAKATPAKRQQTKLLAPVT